MSIEDIILDRDRRGISALRGELPPSFCEEAATLILEHPGTVFIATGFYILAAGAPETDGPPGAVVIGDALQSLGYTVVYISDRHTAPLLTSLVGHRARVVDFPITDHQASQRFARDLLAELAPSVLIAIERCGFTHDRVYRNMHGQDISPYNAKLDYLFHDHPHTVGIGDGGNEIGMGNLAQAIPQVASLVKEPCVTRVSRLVLSSVSNWGGYGLVAALSQLKGRVLLPSVEAEQEMVRQTVRLGAVDGMAASPVERVDGFSLEENSQTLVQLHAWLAQEGVTA